MAIAFDASAVSTQTATTSLTFSHTCSGASRVLLVGLTVEDGDTVTGVTYNGIAMTQLRKQARGDGSNFIYVYGLIAPATSANNVVISSSVSTTIKAISLSYTGVKQSGLPDASASQAVNNSSTASTTANITTVANNSWAVTFLIATGSGGTTITTTIGSGATFRNQDAQPSLRAYDTNGAITPAGLHSMVFNYSANAFFIILGEVSIAPLTSTAYSETYTETATITDSLLKRGGKVLAQSITAADSLIRIAARTLTENTTIGDVLASVKILIKLLSDTVALTESLLRSVARSLSDATTITDTYSKVVSRVFDQSIVLVETFTRGLTYVRSLIEALTITEAIKAYLNGLHTIYSAKYENQGTTYSEKYQARGTQYEKKYPS